MTHTPPNQPNDSFTNKLGIIIIYNVPFQEFGPFKDFDKIPPCLVFNDVLERGWSCITWYSLPFPHTYALYHRVHPKLGYEATRVKEQTYVSLSLNPTHLLSFLVSILVHGVLQVSHLASNNLGTLFHFPAQHQEDRLFLCSKTPQRSSSLQCYLVCAKRYPMHMLLRTPIKT